MATNKLFEAASDILARSKSSAPAEPMHKVEGSEVEDLGGPTPQNSKPDDTSNKLDAGKGSKEAPKPTTKPSAASPALPSTKLKEGKEEDDEDEDDEDDKKEMKESLSEQINQDIEALFADDNSISESFKSKATTLFEARVYDRVQQIEEEVETRYAGMLEEAIDAVKSELTEQVNDYLNYVVEHWIEENEIAIEKGLRSELTEDFIGGLRNLFAEHYIDVPEDKVDLVEELSTQVETLEDQLNEEIDRNITYKKALVESKKSEILHFVCEGLTATQVEKIKSLAESVEFVAADEYAEKLEDIRENYFPSGLKKANEEQLHEHVEDSDEPKAKVMDPFIAAISASIAKTSKH